MHRLNKQRVSSMCVSVHSRINFERQWGSMLQIPQPEISGSKWLCASMHKSITFERGSKALAVLLRVWAQAWFVKLEQRVPAAALPSVVERVSRCFPEWTLRTSTFDMDETNQGVGLIKQIFNVSAYAVAVAHLRCESGPCLGCPRRKNKEACKRSMSKCLPS